ncbi:hypothetical protein FDH34_gp051 [Serratia phage BF]|uniref:Uncharacterized protein n=2 Tax=Eneladusvirus BF TaxID=2560751 RepID=A0A7L8ZLK9_9CAUD|nr:hypothetical protein FDH34_gp051 [Serratia phage BF]AQW88576.1 hypothetical protein BF_0051 [Serratia phage BF]QOI70989.1 hypothetical protein pEaSNUABM12_00051 [Erwinia phage pEa_SNUABM_12]
MTTGTSTKEVLLDKEFRISMKMFDFMKKINLIFMNDYKNELETSHSISVGDDTSYTLKMIKDKAFYITRTRSEFYSQILLHVEYESYYTGRNYFGAGRTYLHFSPLLNSDCIVQDSAYILKYPYDFDEAAHFQAMTQNHITIEENYMYASELMKAVHSDSFIWAEIVTSEIEEDEYEYFEKLIKYFRDSIC